LAVVALLAVGNPSKESKMKKLFFLFFIVILSCKKETKPVYHFTKAQAVMDFSELLTTVEVDSLAYKILDYERKTTRQICIYTIDSIPNGENPLYHATNIGQNLGIGTKEDNNGLLLLVSRLDRKVAIATGIGTEKTITDPIAKNIIEGAIIPHFKNDDYYKGINAGLDSLFIKW